MTGRTTDGSTADGGTRDPRAVASGERRGGGRDAAGWEEDGRPLPWWRRRACRAAGV